jgi:hypothetical protein
MIRIYTLTNPVTNELFYVGASICSDYTIVARHLSSGFRGNRSELRALKLKPIVDTIETTEDPKEAAKLEEYWIHQFKTWGFPLENRRLCSGYPSA